MERNERKVLKFGGWDVREENLLMESEMRKKDRKDIFFFSLRTALFPSVPPRQKGRVGAIVGAAARTAPRAARTETLGLGASW